ncbi:MAG: ATP-grasp domain-containing protein [Treponema sp.]|nr:ATP-grasp domain-containing protein [Treponema sp.]
MKERLIILGAGIMQGPIIRIAKELGFYTVVLDANSQASCAGMADKFEQIDLKDKEGIETFARTLQNSSGGLGGIMTAGTDFSASVAWTAQRLGLPGIPYEAAMNASEKSRMRSCFKKAGLPSPEFITITKDYRFEKLSLPGNFPLVIKPVDNMGSRGCRRIDNADEFKPAAEAAIGFSRSGRAIVEAYMDGPEFSVDAIVYHGEITICGLADRHIFFPPYFIEMGHTMPTVIEEGKQQKILETFCDGIRALGLAGKGSAGAAKGDIKLTEKGPMIGEIAARLSGGYMSGWTYPYASGVQPIRAAILAAMGRKPDNLVPLKKWTCAERAFISIPGTVKSIHGIEEARNLPMVKEVFTGITNGSKVTFPENNVTKCGNVIAAAEDRGKAIEAAENAARSILIRLDPDDKKTAEFLSSAKPGMSFPPDAFDVNPEIIPEKGCLAPFRGLKDYCGRTVEECLEAVRVLTGFSLIEAIEKADNKIELRRSFWAALVRGSYQGAVYYIDNLGIEKCSET